jgi:hypothetical protein
MLRSFGTVDQVAPDSVLKSTGMRSYFIEGISKDDFQRDWETLLPWMKGICELGPEDFTLRVKDPPGTYDTISTFCEAKLLPDLRGRDDALWYDHVTRDGVAFLPRLAPYLAAMFILSNVSRYEPELLAEPTRELTNAGYALTTFLDSAERFFPQLILGLLYGDPVFFE